MDGVKGGGIGPKDACSVELKFRFVHQTFCAEVAAAVSQLGGKRGLRLPPSRNSKKKVCVGSHRVAYDIMVDDVHQPVTTLRREYQADQEEEHTQPERDQRPVLLGGS